MYFGNILCCLGLLLIQANLNFSLCVNFPILENNNINLFLIFDSWSVSFLSVLLVIVGSVFLFSHFYMNGDIFNNRFILILFFFVVSMIFLIFVPVSIFFFIGWDGLGVISFLLVSYYNANSSWSASLKTYLLNRIGDSFLIVCLSLALLWNNIFLDLIFFTSFFSFLLVLGLFTKSAQFPFSSWLPAAMAAPTPVSALVHSSTLVTAGVYILFRLSVSLNIFSLFFLSSIGLLTSLIGGLCAFFEWDSKKIVAFSTLSNLGIMIYAIGVGIPENGFFHLLTHAVSKALLFITVGFAMINNNHSQDLRFFSFNVNFNLFINLTLVYSILSLSGFIFFSGFFSKDSIIESFSGLAQNSCNNFAFLIVVLVSILYGFRLINSFVLTNRFNNSCYNTNSLGFVPSFLLYLFILSLFLGQKYIFYVASINDSLFSIKIYVYTLFIVLFFFNNVSLNNYSFNSINFLVYFNSSFFIHFFSSIGYNTNKVFDNGLLNYSQKVLYNFFGVINIFNPLSFSLGFSLVILLLFVVFF